MTAALGATGLEVGTSPISEFKSVKNDAEVAGLRACGARDGANLCFFF